MLHSPTLMLLATLPHRRAGTFELALSCFDVRFWPDADILRLEGVDRVRATTTSDSNQLKKESFI
jgi:hypothetical protein